jgi:hypothetical protein
MKYRKRPVVIEATQWFKNGDHPMVKRRMIRGIIGDGSTDKWVESNTGWIDTLEGGHIVTPGDWIITGVKGEHYPCKPDIFAMTYEPVEESPAPLIDPRGSLGEPIV